MIEAFFDGSVLPYNPGGHGGYGIVVKRDGQTIYSEAVYVGRWPSLSNNCTEYAGCISVLRYFLRENITRAVVYGDADMIVKQVNGEWRVRSGAYIPYFQEAYPLKQQLPQVVIRWIPREQNSEADALSKQAVCRRPSVIGFQLDPAIKPLIVPRPKRKTERQIQREMKRERFRQVREDDAWAMFQQRYGDV